MTAKRLGVGRNTLARYETNLTVPDADFLKKFSELYGVDAAELIASESTHPYRHEPTPVPKKQGVRRLGPDPGLGSLLQAPELISIPSYSVDAGAGSGRASAEGDRKLEMQVSRTRLAAWGVSAGGAQLLVAKGPSMEPTIGDGEAFLVDTTPAPFEDAIYVIRRGGDLQVKRLQLSAGSKLKIISDNRAFGEETVSLADEDMALIGRVRVIFKRV